MDTQASQQALHSLSGGYVTAAGIPWWGTGTTENLFGTTLIYIYIFISICLPRQPDACGYVHVHVHTCVSIYVYMCIAIQVLANVAHSIRRTVCLYDVEG